MFKERAIVFIDGNNLYNGLKACYGIDRLELGGFCKHIIKDRLLMGIYYADANFLQNRGKENYNKQQEYFADIKRLKNLRFLKGYYNSKTNPPTEKLADVFLATNMVDLCHRAQFDIAYLVSGDSDYIPAVDIVIREGKKVMNVYFDNNTRNSYNLRSHCQGRFKNITATIAFQYKWTQNTNPEPCGSGDSTSIGSPV